jgi:protein-S-isoprenylcysteine O-methyltransferase Ste14
VKRAPTTVECARCGATYEDPELGAKIDAGDMNATSTCVHCAYTPEAWKLVVVRGRWQEARGARLALGRALSIAFIPVAFFFGWFFFRGMTTLHEVLPFWVIAALVLIGAYAHRWQKRRSEAISQPKK